MDMKLKVAEYIAQAAQQSFENCALTGNDVSAMIETPPDKKMGDYALPCFRLSKTMRCAPQMIAGKLADAVLEGRQGEQDNAEEAPAEEAAETVAE